MSTTAETPLEILIPSLPNDIALRFLVRVPRQCHPILSAVSKPIRSLLSCPDFFAARSALSFTEHLLYLRLESQISEPERWFTLYRRPIPNSVETGNVVLAPVPGIPNERLRWSNYAAVGHKIYVLGGEIDGAFSTEVWVFDCRFHTWEQGPSMPTRRDFARTVVLDGKIYVIGWSTKEESWADVFDTVAGRWEALACPKLGFDVIRGCGIRGGQVCVWLLQEELRFDPVMKTWEVTKSGFGFWFYYSRQICEVNGVLYCYDNDRRTLEGFDEQIGVWKKLKLMNKGFRTGCKSRWIGNVGGRLVIIGSELLRDLPERIDLWLMEMEVQKDGDGNFTGEILWSEMIYSCHIDNWDTLSYNCMPISL